MKLTLCLLSLGAFAASFSQGTAEDYRRSAQVGNLTRGKVFRATVDPHWISGGRLWYRVQSGLTTFEWVLVEASGEAKRFQNEADLKKALGGTFGEDSSTRLTERPTQRPGGDRTTVTFDNRTDTEISIFWVNGDDRVAYGKIAPGQTYDQGTVSGHSWEVRNAAGKILGYHTCGELATTVIVDGKYQPVERAPQAGGQRAGFGATSPDRKWTASIRDNNVWIRSGDGGDGVQVTTDGKAEDTYANGGFNWSPDSTSLVTFRSEPAQEHKVNIVSSSPRDQLQPKTITLDYLKPGDRITHPRPVLIDVIGKKATPINDSLFPDPWSLDRLSPNGGQGVTWAADSSKFYFAYNQRGHQLMRVISVNAKNGNPKTLFEDTSKTFIHYSGKYWATYRPQENEIIWMSERDGWNHLYAHDANTGEVKRQITKGNWVVRGVETWDANTGDFLLRVAGQKSAQDPYYVHYLRVNASTGKSTNLTDADGTHRVIFSPDGTRYLSIYSRVDLPPVTEFRQGSDGKLLATLEKGTATELFKTGWSAPERFVAKGRDGKTDIYGILIRPTNFDPKKKYPVIEQIYAGPQGFFVPKAWSSSYAAQQALAELGFLVVQIDGMGTDGRGKAFHDVCFKNLKDAGFPDRILWMRALAAKVPAMDISRVGVYGGSAGGQNAMAAVLWHGDFYKAAAADCGCHDNRMDKVWWNEQWMGYPVDKSYEDSSNVVNAKLLTGDLLLTVGEVDSNVDPASTMQVVDALIKANKPFEFMIFPGMNHGAGGATTYGQRMRMDFFVRTLLKVQPPAWRN